MKPNCLIEGCVRDKKGTRGLCRDHYQVAIRRVRHGKTTWMELELLGLCEKSHKTPSGELSSLFDSVLSTKRLSR